MTSRTSTVTGVTHVVMSESSNEQRTDVLAVLIGVFDGRAIIDKWGGGTDVWVECTFGNEPERRALWAEAEQAVRAVDRQATVISSSPLVKRLATQQRSEMPPWNADETIGEPDEPQTLGSCGCIDYHMADCPTRTAAHDLLSRDEYDPYGDMD